MSGFHCACALFVVVLLLYLLLFLAQSIYRIESFNVHSDFANSLSEYVAVVDDEVIRQNAGDSPSSSSSAEKFTSVFASSSDHMKSGEVPSTCYIDVVGLMLCATTCCKDIEELWFRITPAVYRMKVSFACDSAATSRLSYR